MKATVGKEWKAMMASMLPFSDGPAPQVILTGNNAEGDMLGMQCQTIGEEQV